MVGARFLEADFHADKPYLRETDCLAHTLFCTAAACTVSGMQDGGTGAGAQHGGGAARPTSFCLAAEPLYGTPPVGNPGGSPEATRRAFNKRFLLDLAEDWQQHG